MNRTISGFILFLIAGGAATDARAFCAYHRQMYAKTTLAQEFRDSKWIARATVISAKSWRGKHDWGTTYNLKRVVIYKGQLPQTFALSTERNSGGFYLDMGMKPDIGGEYLLFLIPDSSPAEHPAAVRKSLWINYSCGQSRSWSEVSGGQRAQLIQLSRNAGP
ncbi:MAG: hypothetical protein KGM49_02485 [Sphingomonadales bacterium]|nr:hypothetical protein [Sphingomonadales bacterium]